MWDFDTWSSKDQGQLALINQKAPCYIVTFYDDRTLFYSTCDS